MNLLTKQFIAVIIVTLVSAVAHSGPDTYIYLDIKVGTFINPCTSCIEPDGRIPAYLSLGHAWEWVDHNIDLELLHRSNADVGWPIDNRSEYDMNGIFLKYRYKWRY